MYEKLLCQIDHIKLIFCVSETKIEALGHFIGFKNWIDGRGYTLEVNFGNLTIEIKNCIFKFVDKSFDLSTFKPTAVITL